MTNVGVLCRHGQGVMQDYQQAMPWQIKSTEKESDDAMFNAVVL